MENIILTNNKDLRLVSVKVGVLSTLRFELPLVSASATHVEVIVTSGNVHSAYTATFIDATKRWQCDIAASQFPTVGKQSYEVAYVLDGKQFWDGKGWIEIEDATTSGIEPQPRPEPYRYAVVSVNGYGADAQGAVRIPKTFIATDSPTTTEGYMEGDIYFNRETGATWTLCNVQGTLTWVAVEGVITFDDNVTRTSANGVKSSGIWSAIWGALSALPTGFASLYDWVVAQLAGKASTADLDPLLFAQYYPDGSVKSTAEFTPGIKYDSPDTTNRTITVKPFCNTGDTENDNSELVGRVVIPPFVDANGNGYITDDGTRYEVIGIMSFAGGGAQTNLTAVIAPTTVYKIGNEAFNGCERLVSAVFPAVMRVESGAFNECYALTSFSLPSATYVDDFAFPNCRSLLAVSLPAATNIGEFAFTDCRHLVSASLPSAASIGDEVFSGCSSLMFVDFGTTLSSVPTLGSGVFYNAPSTCKIVVPDSLYDEWVAAPGWRDLYNNGNGYKFLRHSEWEYARKYEVDKKANRAANPTAGNLAALDANGNPTDSTIPAANVAVKSNIPYALVTKTITNGAVSLDDRASNAVTVSATLSPNTLTINFPTAPTGKLRDFAMRLNIAAGVTAPEIAWPQGVTLENNGGEVPEIADGGTGGSSTILYFSESENNGTTAKFTVKGETLVAITPQA